MESNSIIELLNQVLLRLENLITKLDDNGLLSMTRIARSREESLEHYRRQYARQNGQPTTVNHGQHVGREECDCGCSAYNEAYSGEDEID